MSYVDGFVIAVPTVNKQALIDHAGLFDPIFLEYGATRVLECWGDDVPHAPDHALRWRPDDLRGLHHSAGAQGLKPRQRHKKPAR